MGGYAYHVLNRSVERRLIFRKGADFAAFERVLGEAVERSAGGVALLAYCVMGNHWHLVIHTTSDGELSPFMKWLTLTHTQRYRTAHRSVGNGPLYQGRCKSFVIETGTSTRSWSPLNHHRRLPALDSPVPPGRISPVGGKHIVYHVLGRKADGP